MIFVAYQTAVVGRPTTITVPWFQLRPALELLTVGLAVICAVGVGALAGRSLSGKAWARLVVLVALAFTAVLQSDTPVADRWWQPAPGQNVGQNAALGHWWIHEHQASGILLLRGGDRRVPTGHHSAHVVLKGVGPMTRTER